MRYLVDKLFLAETGTPFRMTVDIGEDPIESTASLMLLTVIDSFQPNPQSGQVLKMDEIRHMNEAAKFFEERHGELGYGKPGDVYAFEETQWAVIKKLVEWRMPIMGSGWTRSAPAMLDFLEAIPKEDPRLVEDDQPESGDLDNGVVADIKSLAKEIVPAE